MRGLNSDNEKITEPYFITIFSCSTCISTEVSGVQISSRTGLSKSECQRHGGVQGLGPWESCD